MENTIKSERLILRPWRVSDSAELYALASDPMIGPAAGWPPHKSVEDSESIITNVLSEENTYAVILKESGEIVGSIGLFPTGEKEIEKEEGELEVGYWVGRRYWGMGYAPEAVDSILDYAFNTLECQKVWCGAFQGNTKSMRVQEKCGFTFSHKEKVYVKMLSEERIESFTFITKEEWLKKGGR